MRKELKVTIQVVDPEPLYTDVDEIKAIKNILMVELANYNFEPGDIDVEVVS